jgi:hypothetical protein
MLTTNVQNHKSYQQQLFSLSDPPLIETVQLHGRCLLSRHPSNHPTLHLSQLHIQTITLSPRRTSTM